MDKKHNNPPIVLNLANEQAEFIIDNCNSNITMGMNLLIECQQGSFDEETAMKAAKLMKKFKDIKRLVEDAKKEQLL